MIYTNKEQLARELINSLEKEKGVPVQLKVDTPTGYGVEVFGSFHKRALEVKRVESLDPKYEHDIALLEGRYANLKELKKRITEYDALWGSYGWKGTLAERAQNLVKEKLAETRVLPSTDGTPGIPLTMAYGKQLLVAPIANNFGDPSLRGFEQDVYKLLNENNLTYLQHRIVVGSIEAGPNGLYHLKKIGYMAPIEQTKIADIKLALLE